MSAIRNFLLAFDQDPRVELLLKSLDIAENLGYDHFDSVVEEVLSLPELGNLDELLYHAESSIKEALVDYITDLNVKVREDSLQVLNSIIEGILLLEVYEDAEALMGCYEEGDKMDVFSSLISTVTDLDFEDVSDSVIYVSTEFLTRSKDHIEETILTQSLYEDFDVINEKRLKYFNEGLKIFTPNTLSSYIEMGMQLVYKKRTYLNLIFEKPPSLEVGVNDLMLIALLVKEGNAYSFVSTQLNLYYPEDKLGVINALSKLKSNIRKLENLV